MTGSLPPSLVRRATLEAAIVAVGLVPRGVVTLGPDDDAVALADGRAARSLMLVGWRGRDGWAAFRDASERRDRDRDPLDRWSARVLDGLARDHDATAILPFEGPPWPPFLTWARRAEGLAASPLGLAIDGRVGLWHAFRGALAVADDLGPEAAPQISPCATCERRACLSACPADAFDGSGFDVGRCRGHLESHAGGLCRTDGCRARDACPIGRAHRYAPDQIRFLMSAFRASLGDPR